MQHIDYCEMITYLSDYKLKNSEIKFTDDELNALFEIEKTL